MCRNFKSLVSDNSLFKGNVISDFGVCGVCEIITGSNCLIAKTHTLLSVLCKVHAKQQRLLLRDAPLANRRMFFAGVHMMIFGNNCFVFTQLVFI